MWVHDLRDNVPRGRRSIVVRDAVIGGQYVGRDGGLMRKGIMEDVNVSCYPYHPIKEK